jgi:hypothetical protein
LGIDLDAAWCGIKIVGCCDAIQMRARVTKAARQQPSNPLTISSRRCTATYRLRIRATEAVVVKAAASEMTSSIAKVISAHARHVTPAKAAYVTSTKATHVTSAEATHVASTSVTSATTSVSTAAARLRISGKQTAGKHGTCQNHHHSSSHDILLWDERNFPP